MVNKRIASFLLCLSIVISTLGRVVPKDTFISFKNNKEELLNTGTLEETLKIYIDNTSFLGLQDDMNLTFEDYDILLNSHPDKCMESSQYTKNELYEMILNNTKEYAAGHKEIADPFTDEYYTRHEFNNSYGLKIAGQDMFKIKKQIEKTVLENINFVINNGNSSDIHNYSTLKIVLAGGILGGNISDDVYGVYISDENVIKINMLNILDSADNMSDVLMRLREVLAHEFRHVEQETCLDAKENNIDGSIMSVDAGYYNFLDEASAESSLYNLEMLDSISWENSNLSYTYQEYRKLESKLLLCSMFDNTKKIDEYYKVLRNHDNNGLLEYLGATTKEEKEELIRVIYAINSMLYNTNYIKNLTGKDSDYTYQDIIKMTDKIKYLYNITIMKYSLKSLIKYNIDSLNKKDNSLSLEENIYLYYLITSNLVDDCYLESNNVLSYYETFLEEYKSLQENYFAFLSKLYKEDVEKIRGMFLNLNAKDINYELGAYYGNIIDDCEFKDNNWIDNDTLITLMNRFPKLKVIAFQNYRDIKEQNYQKNNGVWLIEGIINRKNVSANYTVR